MVALDNPLRKVPVDAGFGKEAFLLDKRASFIVVNGLFYLIKEPLFQEKEKHRGGKGENGSKTTLPDAVIKKFQR